VGSGGIAFFVYSFSFPLDFHAQGLGGNVHELTHRVLLACGNDKIFGVFLLVA
jgi:hypothetical protein